MSLVLEELSVSYRDRVAVKPTALSLARGGLVALIGPNGAGKTTLLRALAGLLPASGKVRWSDLNLKDLAPRKRAQTLAYLPQSAEANWPMLVRDLVALGRLPHRSYGSPINDDDERAIEWAMAQTEISGLADRSVAELSGGERARVHLARALVVEAPILLVDEPVASLDPYHQLQIMSLLADYSANDRVVIAVMHDLILSARYSSRVLLMHEGQIVADGKPEQVLTDESLARYYRVEAYLAEHETKPVVVPLRRID